MFDCLTVFVWISRWFVKPSRKLGSSTGDTGTRVLNSVQCACISNIQLYFIELPQCRRAAFAKISHLCRTLLCFLLYTTFDLVLFFTILLQFSILHVGTIIIRRAETKCDTRPSRAKTTVVKSHLQKICMLATHFF